MYRLTQVPGSGVHYPGGMSAPIGPLPDDASGAPSRPARPDSVSIASELWLVVVIGQIVAFFAQYQGIADSIREQVHAGSEGVPANQVTFMTSTPFIVTVLVGVAVVLSVIPLVFVWLARRGYNWARVVVAAMGVYVTVDMIWAFFVGRDPVWAMVPTVLSGVAGLGATILLMRRESDTYCRAMAEFRKPRPVTPPPLYPPHGWGQPGPGVAPPQVPPTSPPYGETRPTPDPPGPTPPGPDHPTGDHDTRADDHSSEGRRARDQS